MCNLIIICWRIAKKKKNQKIPITLYESLLIKGFPEREAGRKKKNQKLKTIHWFSDRNIYIYIIDVSEIYHMYTRAVYCYFQYHSCGFFFNLFFFFVPYNRFIISTLPTDNKTRIPRYLHSFIRV